MTWLRRLVDRMFGRSPHEPDPVIPQSREHRVLLERADAVLEDGRIKELLSQRDQDLRDSFGRANRRLGHR